MSNFSQPVIPVTGATHARVAKNMNVAPAQGNQRNNAVAPGYHAFQSWYHAPSQVGQPHVASGLPQLY